LFRCGVNLLSFLEQIMSESISPAVGTALPAASAQGDAPPLGHPSRPTPRLRLWPLVLIVVLQWCAMLIPGWVAPATLYHFYGGFFGPFLGGIAAALWWLLASRLPWTDRVVGLCLFAAIIVQTWLLADASFELPWLLFHGLPLTTTAVVLWLVATPFLRWPLRRAGLFAVVVAVWCFFLLVRHEGFDGSFRAEFPWRWDVSAEARFLAERKSRQPVVPVADATPAAPLQAGDWPGFRGAQRDGRYTGEHITTDWNERAPRKLWRQRVGPGWSSFAVVGSRLYTQEQHGPDEAVVCYDADTGKELWAQQERTRFAETMGGPGPRATPTFHDGKIYAQGATGKLHCLDAVTGKVVWTSDVAADAGAKVPQWGYAASPLVMQGVVIAFGGGDDGKSVLGYDAASGKLAWAAGEGQFSYCSPHPARIDGVEQAVMSTDHGLAAYDPVKGTVLWRHEWPLKGGMARVVQPTRAGDADFLLGTGFGIGTRRVHVSHDKDTWDSKEVWTTRAIKPYYNDLIVHHDHLYGFSHDMLTCVSLADGKEKWSVRGYGNGQVLLLKDQDLLLVQAEKGFVALVEAKPGEHVERARFEAIEGKTWNHPVVVRGKLFVRNSEEMGCYLVGSGQ
jgi:outer membrane protein assembly factor BamB